MNRPPGKDPARNGKGDSFDHQQYINMNNHLLRQMSSGLSAKVVENAIRLVTEQVSNSRVITCTLCVP